MRTTSNSRRLTLVALLAAAGVGAATVPAASVAQPVGGTAPKKDCNLLGTRIGHGQRGRRDGVQYECNDGVACQVEGGRTTTRCSHASRVKTDLRGVRVPVVGLSRG